MARQGNHAGFYANRRIWTTGGFANWVFNGELVSRKAGPEWTPVAPLATPRSRLALVHFPINGKFYAIGGEGPESNRNLPIEEYDPASDTWTDRTMLAVGVSNVGAVVVGDRIHIPGGWDGLVARKEHQIFDPLTNTVVLGEPMPMESFAHAVTARGKFIHVLGGFDHGEYPTTAHYIFDTDGNTWTNGAVLPEPVNYPAASSDGRYVYLFGGGTSDTHKAWRYDPILDSWTALPDLLTARGGPAAFPANGTFNVVGGGWNSYLDSMESFDGRVWVEGPTLVTGARTIGADAGGGIALKAGGYQEDYLASAEKLAVTGGGLGEYCNSVKTPIPDNGSTISTIVVPDARRIKNLSVKLSVKHGFVGDLAFTLSKGATSVTFFDRPGRTDSGFGCGGQNIAASFADDRGADGAWETSCMNTNPAFASGGRYTNNEPLSAFDGKSSAGTWMLTATDHADGNAGTLDEWCIKLAPTDVIFDDGFEG